VFESSPRRQCRSTRGNRPCTIRCMGSILSIRAGREAAFTSRGRPDDSRIDARGCSGGSGFQEDSVLLRPPLWQRWSSSAAWPRSQSTPGVDRRDRHSRYRRGHDRGLLGDGRTLTVRLIGRHKGSEDDVFYAIRDPEGLKLLGAAVAQYVTTGCVSTALSTSSSDSRQRRQSGTESRRTASQR
jgi:hypothetical protein